jgi:hypothetical protein
MQSGMQCTEDSMEGLQAHLDPPSSKKACKAQTLQAFS